jgi:hypothetical protein
VVSSIRPREVRARVHEKTNAIGLVEVSLPF